MSLHRRTPHPLLPKPQPPIFPFIRPPGRSQHEIDELVRRPLDNKELYGFRHRFSGYHAGTRFEEASRQERERIMSAWRERDQHGRYVYRGLDLIGRAGGQRADVMIRNCVRKRWERLGVWNSEWEIPITGGSGTGDNDNPILWRWEWDTAPLKAQSA